MSNSKMTISNITNSFKKYQDKLNKEYQLREEARKHFNRRWSELQEEGEMAINVFSELLIEKLVDELNVCRVDNGDSLIEIYIDEKKNTFINTSRAKISFHMKKMLSNFETECTWMVRNEETIDAITGTMDEDDTIDDVFNRIMSAIKYQSQKYPEINWR